MIKCFSSFQSLLNAAGKFCERSESMLTPRFLSYGVLCWDSVPCRHILCLWSFVPIAKPAVLSWFSFRDFWVTHKLMTEFSPVLKEVKRGHVISINSYVKLCVIFIAVKSIIKQICVSSDRPQKSNSICCLAPCLLWKGMEGSMFQEL